MSFKDFDFCAKRSTDYHGTNIERITETNYGLNDDQVAGIEKLGVKIESDMVLLKESDLTGVEINVITARKIVAAYKLIKPATAPVTDTTSSAPGELPKNYRCIRTMH